jgi:hypothetical protein
MHTANDVLLLWRMGYVLEVHLSMTVAKEVFSSGFAIAQF